MVTIKCIDIASFGKLSNYHLEFGKGFNTIIAGNSSGKSTVAMFIKCMFYGFDYKKVFDLDKDSTLYNPWVKTSQFGGSLDYQLDGVDYRITRTFGKTQASERTTHIRIDNNTDMPTNGIGESLFGINSESFMKSIYIPQEDISIANSSDFRAKLSTMIDGSGSNYEKADKILEKKMRELSLFKGNGGEIYKCQQQLQSVSSEIMHARSNQQQLVSNTQQLAERKKQLATTESQLQGLNAKVIDLTATIASSQLTDQQIAEKQQYLQAKQLVSRPQYQHVDEHLSEINRLNNAPKSQQKMSLSLRILLMALVVIASVVCAVLINVWCSVGVLLAVTIWFATKDKAVSYDSEIAAVLSNYRLTTSQDNLVEATQWLYSLRDELNSARAVVDCYVEPKVNNGQCETQLQQAKMQLAELGRNKNALLQEIGRLSSSIERLGENDNLAELHEQQMALQSDLEVLTHRRELVERARNIITQAKNNMSSSYIPKLSSGVSKLLDQFTGGKFNKIDIDDNFNVSVHEHGTAHPLHFFSRGVKELVLFCCRIVLSQLVYSGNAPLLIIDDTFVNVDDATQQLLFSQLGSWSQNSQLIYLSCHRLPSNCN